MDRVGTQGAESAPTTVDVVVPVYGKWALTAACLESVRAQTLPARVVVVDNASPDDTLDRVLAEFPEVEVIAMGANRGFAAACNAGIRQGTADVVVLLNNDVVAEPGMLAELAAAFADDAGLGSAGPLLLRPDGLVDSAGICADVTCAGFVRHHGRPLEGALDAEPRLLGPYGAVAAYRRSALDEVGLLDEGIFMYGEELDLALRLSAAGWGTTVVHAARGVHAGGGTAGRGSSRQRHLSAFGRGYLLRAYRVLRGRHAVRALLTEVAVCLWNVVVRRDVVGVRGRVEGFRAGASAQPRPTRIPGLDPSIGTGASLLMRVPAVRQRLRRRAR